MIKSEWQSFFKNKFMVVAIIAIMIIPTIYTTIFLGSMWDPYGNVDKLPVAIVNKDKSVIYEDKVMDVGNELVDNLKESNSLDFNFVDEDVAERGLENGTYYMVVTIPEDFSANATTLMDDEPQQMALDYETNPGTNYIASKMSETAIEKIRNGVQEKITKQYAETIFDKVQTLGDGLNEAADGTATALDGVQQLKDGNNEITTNLQTLASSSLTFKDGADELNIGLKQYTDGVSTAKNGSDELNSGSKQLSEGISQYTDGVSTAKNGSDELNPGLKSLNGGIAQYTAGVSTASNGIQSILSALNQISGQIGTSLSEDNKKQLKELQSGAVQLNDGIQTLNNTLQSTDISSNNISNSLKTIGEKAETAGNDYEKMSKEIASSSAFNSLDDTQKAEILKILNDNGASLKNGLTSIGSNTQSVANEVYSLGASVGSLKENVNKIANVSNQVLPASSQTIENLANGLGSVKTVLDRQGTTPDTIGLIQAMNSLNNGMNQLVLKNNELTSGAASASNGMQQLNDGLTTLVSKNNELTSGATSASNGVQQLNDGLGTLVSKNNELLSGTSKLASGAEQISDGSGKLRDGSQTLGNGLNDLYDGTVTLNDGLSDGADEVNSINPTDDTYDMMAAPINAEETQMTKVDNNGNAMAPYMMCVALWVACIAFCIMYPLTSHSGKVESGFKWWLSKASVIAVVTVLQAIIMIFMLKAINGFNPAQLGKIVFVSCLLSVTFMSIMYFFNILLDKVGSFLMIVFMVLQLGGCGGTYPLELASKFYTIIKPFMPFTYGVHAFRSAICGGASITKDVIFLTSVLALFIVLTIIVFNLKAKKIMKENEISNKEELSVA